MASWETWDCGPYDTWAIPYQEATYTRESFQATARRKTDDFLNERKSAIDEAMDLLMDLVSNSKAKNKQVEGIVTLHVDDVFITGTTEFIKDITTRLSKDFQVGTLDKNDIMFVGQRIQ